MPPTRMDVRQAVSLSLVPNERQAHSLSYKPLQERQDYAPSAARVSLARLPFHE